MMFNTLRLVSAWKYVSFGMPIAALKVLAYGDPDDHFEIVNPSPICTYQTFSEMMAALNLSKFENALQPNMTLQYPNHGQLDDGNSMPIFIQLVAHHQNPVLDVSFLGRFTDIHLKVKLNPDMNVWQIDDACIVEHSQSLDENDQIFNIPCDHRENSPHLLAQFVTAFHTSVPAILSKDAQAETGMFKLFKPIRDEARELEVRQLQQEATQSYASGTTPVVR